MSVAIVISSTIQNTTINCHTEVDCVYLALFYEDLCGLDYAGLYFKRVKLLMPLLQIISENRTACVSTL